LSHKINQITETLVSIRDRPGLSESERDTLAEAANTLQGFARQWGEIFATVGGGDDNAHDYFIDITAEQIEACLALTQ